jgi:gamma-glutamyltranspeptidase / glutathione hydrolase
MFTTRPEIQGTFGAIATTHWIATGVGMSVLERGGNAFDAAAAAGFVLQIVEPHLNGPGGEVPIILKRHSDPEPIVICGQGPFPAAATLDRFAALALRQMPGTGLLPAVVPGAFDAWMLLLRDYGTWRVADVLEPAIAYAENGFPVLPRVAASILAAKDFFAAQWPTSGEAWLPHGEVPRPRSLLRTPTVAATYRRLVAEAVAGGSSREAQIAAAREAFYRGFVADAVDRFYRSEELMDSTGRRHGGLLRGDDLARYSATVEPTVSREYRGVEVHKTGPWGQGPVLLQALALLEGFDLEAMHPAGETFVHTVVECMKLAYADREVFYGDPAFVDVPVQTLLSPAYASERRRLIGEGASLELRPGDLPGAAERTRRVLDMAGAEVPVGLGHGEPTFAPLPLEWGDTVHLDVVDWSRPLRRADGCRALPPSRSSVSRSPRADKCAGSNLGTLRRFVPAPVRGRRSRPRSSPAMARPGSRSAPPAGINRTSGPSLSCCATFITDSICKSRSTCRFLRADTFPSRSIRAWLSPAGFSSRSGLGRQPWPVWRDADTS